MCLGAQTRRDCGAHTAANHNQAGLHQTNKKALAGEIPHFTGVTDPYEPPLTPEVLIHSNQENPQQSADRVWATLQELGLVSF